MSYYNILLSIHYHYYTISDSYAICCKNRRQGWSLHPGPGSYTISNSPQGPKFSIGGAKIDPLFWGRGNSPGPGSYSLNDEVENRLLGGRFSSSKRPKAKPNDNPGPGFYDCKAALCFQGNKNVSYSKMYKFENGPAFNVKSKISNTICKVV